jgi:hypothetical protein
VVYTIVSYAANNSIFNTHIVVGIVGIFGMVVILVGVAIIMVTSLILEKNTTQKRKEIEDVYLQNVNKKNTAKNNFKEKETSKGKVRLHWYVGFAMACISGLGQPLLGIGLLSANTFANKVILASPTMTLFKIRLVLATFGLLFGFVLVFTAIFMLLLFRGSVRKLVVFEGGLLAGLDGCYNFKYIRLIGMFVSLLMGCVFYLSFVLYIYAESFSLTNTSFQYVIWTGVATVIYFIVGQVFKEMANTKLFVKILIVVGFLIEMFGFLIVGFSTANYRFNFTSNSTMIANSTTFLTPFLNKGN